MQSNLPRILWIEITLLVAGLVHPASAQIIVNAAADTPESAALRGGGQFLRGAGWYNLNTARANSINLDTQIRWAREMRHIQAIARTEKAKSAADKKLKEKEIKNRLKAREQALRVAPMQDDIRSGDALNILLCDLMDPRITSEQWQAKPAVPLPQGASVKDMIFKFVRGNGASQLPGVIALSRLNVARRWPTALNYDGLKTEKSACEAALATVRKQVLEDEFEPDSVQALDESINNLQARVTQVVPLDNHGFRAEALHYVKNLRDATRMFDARTVEYAKEMLKDTEDHDATTVAELVAFSLKFRLQFASAKDNPSAEALYPGLFEVMKKQVNALSIQPEDDAEPDKLNEFIENPEFANGFDGWNLEGGASGFQIFKKDGRRTLLTFGNKKDKNTGRVYQVFQIPLKAKELHFEVSGGKHKSVYVALKHDEKTYFRASAHNSNNVSNISWNLKELRGKPVVLEVVDESTGPWGFIGVQNFRLVADKR